MLDYPVLPRNVNISSFHSHSASSLGFHCCLQLVHVEFFEVVMCIVATDVAQSTDVPGCELVLA